MTEQERAALMELFDDLIEPTVSVGVAFKEAFMIVEAAIRADERERCARVAIDCARSELRKGESRGAEIADRIAIEIRAAKLEDAP